MSLANLLKKDWLAGIATVTVATPATVEPDKPRSVAKVASVAVANPTKTKSVGAAANDSLATAGVGIHEIRTSEPLHCSSSDWHERDKAYQGHHANCPACIAAGKGYGTRCDTGAELWTAYSETHKSAPTRAWAAPATPTPTADISPPLLTAATDAEIQRMAERLALFAGRGVGVQDAEKLVDKLLVRDREGDDRVACAECHRLVGNAPGRWRCDDRAPILSNDLAGAWLGAAFVHQSLHRCRSFAEVKP